MQGNNKPPNIHVNPIFTDNTKPSIHINPKVHINMAIHVNPRMVNVLRSVGIQHQPNLKNNNFQKKSLISKNNFTENKEGNIQKSIYVNPKLMEKLTNKVPDVVKNPKAIVIKNQPKNSLSIGQLNTHKFVKKSPNLISLSRRKLVRIIPDNEKKIHNSKIQTKKINKSNQLKIIHINNSNKLKVNHLSNNKINNQLKKINVSSQSKKINLINLEKIHEVASKSLKNCANKYKIDRTVAEKKNKAQVSRKTLGASKNLIKIDGVLYRSSKSCLVKSNNNNSTGKSKTTAGIKKQSLNTSKSKKLRKHVIINGKITKINTSNLSKSFINSGQKSNYKHVVSNRVKQRSLQILRHKMCKNNQPCLLYQRFGYCAKYIEGTCPKVHDKKQVALCKNFLQGKCHLDNCQLSHDVGPEKMPTCRYFLEGCCTRDNCQYLHVKVSANTPICVPFLRGYCAKGDQCKERHTNICPEFEKYGKCQKGKNCPYPHKSCLLQQQNHLKLPSTIKSSYKKKLCDKIVVISSQNDDNKKRYYDDDKSDDNLELKRCNINKKIRIITMIHQASKDNDVEIVDNDDDMKSQPINDDSRPKRPPIGPLPSYIPIN